MPDEYIALFAGDRASDYDRMMPIWTPDHKIINETIKYLLLSILPEPSNILIVGSGTGTEIVTLAQNTPKWQLTGIDPSPEMNSQANQKIAQYQLESQCNIIEGTLSSIPQNSTFDAATLLHVLQFMPDNGYKLNTLKDIANRLKPGGKLAIVDFFGTRSHPVFIQQRTALFRYILSGDLTHTQTQESLTKALEEVQFVSEKRMMELFIQAGFKNIQRFYQVLITGGWLLEK